MAYGSSRKCARKVLIFLKSNLLSFRMLVLRPNSVYMPHQQHAVKWIGLKVFLIYIADWASCKLFCLQAERGPQSYLGTFGEGAEFRRWTRTIGCTPGAGVREFFLHWCPHCSQVWNSTGLWAAYEPRAAGHRLGVLSAEMRGVLRRACSVCRQA